MYDVVPRATTAYPSPSLEELGPKSLDLGLSPQLAYYIKQRIFACGMYRYSNPEEFYTKRLFGLLLLLLKVVFIGCLFHPLTVQPYRAVPKVP